MLYHPHHATITPGICITHYKLLSILLSVRLSHSPVVNLR